MFEYIYVHSSAVFVALNVLHLNALREYSVPCLINIVALNTYMRAVWIAMEASELVRMFMEGKP